MLENSVHPEQGIETAWLLSFSKHPFSLEERHLPGETGDILVGGWGMQRAKDRAAVLRLWPQIPPLPAGHPVAPRGATNYSCTTLHLLESWTDAKSLLLEWEYFAISQVEMVFRAG